MLSGLNIVRKSKTFKIMRIVLFLTAISITQSLAIHSYAQGTRLNLKFKSEAIVNILDEIENQSEFYFMYDATVVNVNQKKSINCENRTVSKILDELFKDTGITYKIEDRQIALREINEKLEVYVNRGNQQKKTISGRVNDSAGIPLPGVTVVIKGTASGTVTDFEGNYSIANVPGDATLVFSFVGMKTQEIAVAGKAKVDVKMEADAIGIEEVVAVGYGVQKKVNLTGAVSTVEIEKIENRPITNASQALQGVSGLYVNQAGGQPGNDEATIRIRGLGTLNENDPLVLVDGIEYPLSDVNPSDIESISVLKDAASASIYGNRAANGVILITTKKGSQNKSKIEYSNYFGIQATTYLPDVVKDPVEFMKLRNQAQLNAGNVTVDYSDDLIEEYDQGRYSDPYTYPQNDWLDIMFSNAFVQEHNLRFSGGRDKINYTLSLGYMEQEGVLMGTNSNKFTIRSNVNFHVNEAVRVGSDFAATHRFVHEPATTAASMMEMVFKAQGFHPTYLEDGRYANTFVRTPGHNVYRHPLVWANEGFLNNKTLREVMSVYTDIKLPWNLSYFAKGAVNKLDGFEKQFVPDIYMYQVKTLEESRVDYYTDNKNRHVTNGDDEEIDITLYHTLKWDKMIKEKHNFSILLGSSYESFSERYFTATIEGLLSNDLHEIDAGSTNMETTGSSSKNYLIGIFGRLNYSYEQKYLAEVNFRHDGSSKFAKGNRWGFFPSFSVGWRMEQEDFMKDVAWVSGLKLRASYGSLGNERIGNFKYVNMMDVGYGYSFGGETNSGVAITSYNDPNITWETTTIGNFGIDAVLLNNKLNLTFEIYDKKTKNILREVNLASQVGNLNGPVKNIGDVDNKGFELNVGCQDKVNDFSYGFNLGINYNKNKVVNLNGQEIIATGSAGSYMPTITKEGYPIDSYYVLESDGIFQDQDEIDASPYQNSTTKPGYIKYKNQNDDNTIDTDDRIITGKVTPDYTFDFSLNFSYKNWSLNSFFNGVLGVDTYPQRIIATPFWFGTSVTKEWVNNSWTEDRKDAKLPILTCYEDCVDDNFLYSDFWLLDASYLRLKNLQIAYSFPNMFIKKIGLQKLVLFVNGQNMFTISKMKNFDPERHIKQTNYYEYPSIKIYSAGLNVTF